MLRFVVLLKHGTLEAVECREEDVFRVARIRDAGICGVFANLVDAEAFIVAQMATAAAPVRASIPAARSAGAGKS